MTVFTVTDIFGALKTPESGILKTSLKKREQHFFQNWFGHEILLMLLTFWFIHY